MLENFREAIDGIWSHKLRSALTMLGHTPLKTDYNRFMDQIQPFRNLIHVF